MKIAALQQDDAEECSSANRSKHQFTRSQPSYCQRERESADTGPASVHWQIPPSLISVGRIKAFPFLAWPHSGAEPAADAAAIVVAVGCAFVPVVASAGNASAPAVAASVHSQAFVGAADDLAPAGSGASGVP